MVKDMVEGREVALGVVLHAAMLLDGFSVDFSRRQKKISSPYRKFG